MKKLLLLAAILVALVIPATAQAGWSNTGWYCQSPQPVVFLGGGALMVCNYTNTWWRFVP